MSTIEDFENAPVGATAAHSGSRAMKMDGAKRYWVLQNGLRLNDKEMEHWDYTLDPFDPVSPATAREALALAWELAHPVKEGQFIPEGTACLARFDDGYRSYETMGELITSETWTDTRTLDPLPEPDPDWLDAPAVLAAVKGTITIGDRRQVLARLPDGRWSGRDGNWEAWELTDVTPLYPKGDA